MSLSTALPVRTQGPRIQRGVVVFGLLSLLGVMFLAWQASGLRQSLLTVIGFVAGIGLYRASFGFTAAWRRMIVERRGLGLRVQIIMLGLAILVFFPLLAHAEAFGQPLYGFVNPVGYALCLGAFIFGIGMQLGGGCGSGTLFTVGGGSIRMLVTLASFIAGSVLATADPLQWMAWPALPPLSLLETAGLTGALGTAVISLGVLYSFVTWLESRRHGDAQAIPLGFAGSLLTGPWPMIFGALVLASVNIATLLVAGRPWGITTAFALWGGKVLLIFGVDVASWPYWQGAPSLAANVFEDITSVMNFGIILGALVAAGLAGKFSPQMKMPIRSISAAVIGGLLLGVGARLATGCNIGAFFSGVASGSLHGVIWLVFAIPGNAVGVWLRPKFQLD